jgi:hypothetical protein
VIDYLKRFWAVLVSLAAVAGLYVGAEAVHLTKLFWIVIAVAVVVTGIRPTLRVAADMVIRVRNYPALLSRVAEAERKVVQLSADKRELATEITKARKEGKEIALAQVRGMVLALTGGPPELVAISDDAGVLALVGKYIEKSEPLVGARYSVITAETGSNKGVVEVVRVEAIRKLVWMHCVELTVSEFWQHLRDRVSYDESPPANVLLVQYQIDIEMAVSTKEATGNDVHEVISG